MKTLLMLSVCIIISGITAGQELESYFKNDFNVAQPKFNGIEFAMKSQKANYESLKAYLINNLKYPEENSKKFIEGTEVIRFTVNPSGNLSDFKVINSVSPLIDEEVISVLQSTNGMWIPAYVDGKPVPMEKEISLIFEIQRNNYNTKGKHFEATAIRYFKQGQKKLFHKKNPKGALKSYNKCMRYKPLDPNLLLMRGLCKFELGQKESAKEDWLKMESLLNDDEFKFIDAYFANVDKLGKLKGYNEFISLIKKKE